MTLSIGGQIAGLQQFLASVLPIPVILGATARKDPRMVTLFPLPTEYNMTAAGNNSIRIRKVQATIVAPSALETMSLQDELVNAVQNFRLLSAGDRASTVRASTEDFGGVALEDRLEDGRVYSYVTLEWSE